MSEAAERLERLAAELKEEPFYRGSSDGDALFSVEHACGHSRLYGIPLRALAAHGPERLEEERERIAAYPCGWAQGCARKSSGPAEKGEEDASTS